MKDLPFLTPTVIITAALKTREADPKRSSSPNRVLVLCEA